MGKAGRAGIAAFVAAIAAASAVVATAAAPAGTPDPSAVVLKAADFSGATDVSHSSIGAVGSLVVAYENVVSFKRPYGASKYGAVVSTAFVETDIPNATAAYTRLARSYSTKATRTAIVKQFSGSAKNVKTKAIKPRALGIGDSSMEIGFVATMPAQGTMNFSIELLRIDRILVQNIALGAGKTVAVADAKALTGLVAGHAKSVLGPVSLTPPTVTGTAQVGQTLTATPGTWNSAALTFGYQWQDCDATGTTCTPIAGATASTYVLQPTDANQTVRVVVTGTNPYGAASANSAVTAVVAS